MSYLQVLLVAILFFIFSPNVLFRTPLRANKYIIALLHALLFSIVWSCVNKLYKIEAFNAPAQGTAPGPAQGPAPGPAQGPKPVPRVHKNPISEQCRNNRTDKSCCDEYIRVKGQKYPNIHWNDQTNMCECSGLKCPTAWRKIEKANKKSKDTSK